MDQAALFPFIMSTVDDIINRCDQIEAEKRAEANKTGGQSVLGGKKG